MPNRHWAFEGGFSITHWLPVEVCNKHCESKADIEDVVENMPSISLNTKNKRKIVFKE